MLRHWRPSSWANRELSLITFGGRFDYRIWIIVSGQYSIVSAQQLRAVFTSMPSTNSLPGTAPSPVWPSIGLSLLRYRLYLESRHLAANTINQQLAAVRRLAHEAADAGLLSPELAAGISRVKGVTPTPG